MSISIAVQHKSSDKSPEGSPVATDCNPVAPADAPAVAKKTRTRLPRPPIDLNKPDDRLYTRDVWEQLKISKTTFYEGRKAGRYPAPDGYDQKRAFWLTQTIKAVKLGSKS
ncbi:helix-turn-helix transcriptional regulator [Paraburkholderia sp. BCC1884]|uniref:helix-turn-helix transcriptional regulator n=1 Tax=Paraburkholderia sp. BCC1884 TaxID=2562668 RepID=UPI001182D4D2|nr:hypothetical protein [Paraburkholderia sp. BCC1884]